VSIILWLIFIFAIGAILYALWVWFNDFAPKEEDAPDEPKPKNCWCNIDLIKQFGIYPTDTQSYNGHCIYYRLNPAGNGYNWTIIKKEFGEFRVSTVKTLAQAKSIIDTLIASGATCNGNNTNTWDVM